MDDLQWSNMIESYRRVHERRRRRSIVAILAIAAIIPILVLIALADTALAGPGDAARPTDTAAASAVPDVAPRTAHRAAEDIPDVGFGWTAARSDYEKRINDFLTSYFSNCNPIKLTRARGHVPELLDASEAANVNPSLVAAIVTLESTWDHAAVGKLGERGLMQINRRDASHEPGANLRKGIGMLVHAHEVCGSTFGAVSYYATGSTCKWKGAARRVRLAARIDMLGRQPAATAAGAAE